jgi:aspartate/methionine/tyrosine aminotransferase
MNERAKMLTEAFNGMTNVTCEKIAGAMYGFP